MRAEAGGVFLAHRVNVLCPGGCTNCVSYRMFSPFVCVMWRQGGERSGFCWLSACCRHTGKPSSTPNHQIWALIVKMISLIEFIAECRLISISSPIHRDTHAHAHMSCAVHPLIRKRLTVQWHSFSNPIRFDFNSITGLLGEQSGDPLNELYLEIPLRLKKSFKSIIWMGIG